MIPSNHCFPVGDNAKVDEVLGGCSLDFGVGSDVPVRIRKRSSSSSLTPIPPSSRLGSTATGCRSAMRPVPDSGDLSVANSYLIKTWDVRDNVNTVPSKHQTGLSPISCLSSGLEIRSSGCQCHSYPYWSSTQFTFSVHHTTLPKPRDMAMPAAAFRFNVA